MSLMRLAVPPRAIKGIDQEEIAQDGRGIYVPIEELRHWTGMGVSPQAAMNFIAVYQCVRVLTGAFSMFPLKLYRERDGGGKDPAADHPLYTRLHDAPNRSMISLIWRKVAMRDMAIWGNHYSEKVRTPVRGDWELWPIRPDRIETRWANDGVHREFRYQKRTGHKTLTHDQVFHMQGLMSDGLQGSSPIAELRKTLELANTAETYAQALFKNHARPAVALTHPKTMSKAAIDRLTAQMDELRGSANAGKTVLLEEDVKVTTIGFPPEEAQFLAARLNQHRLIYGAYGIPPHKVGDLERATFNNIEHLALEFIQDGILNWLVNAEQEFKRQLIDERNLFARFSVDAYLRGDAKSRAEALQIRRQNGTLSADEWRELEDENPLPDGAGKSYWMPMNFAPVGAPVAAEEEPIEEPQEPAATATRSLRCPDCGALLAKVAPSGTAIDCRRCKREVVA